MRFYRSYSTVIVIVRVYLIFKECMFAAVSVVMYHCNIVLRVRTRDACQ